MNVKDAQELMEAIHHCEDVICSTEENCKNDHIQLAKWLRELLKLKHGVQDERKVREYNMDLIEKARDIIRDRGFASASELVSELAAYCHEEGIPPSIFPEGLIGIIEEIVCDDIYSVEYANKATELFYYNPDEFFCDGKREEYIDNKEG